MNTRLLKKLSTITEEEQAILEGQTLNRDLYYRGEKDEVDSSLVLTNGKQIDIRPHTRFLHFPKHTHNYVEFVYMVKGSTTHIVDQETILLAEGDLLLLNQHAAQEILPAGEEDIAVNFLILPQFFDEVFRMISAENSSLRDFIVGCLTRSGQNVNYLYFRSRDLIPVQNLLENLIWNLLEDEPNSRSKNQLTMGLLFLTLIDHAAQLQVPERSYEEKVTMELLRYIDTSYPMASLAAFAREAHLDVYTLSRIIKKQTGSTFRALLERRRMDQSAFLLKNTALPVEEIARNVGYENLSFFYRLFQRTFSCRPREYRKKSRSAEV